MVPELFSVLSILVGEPNLPPKSGLRRSLLGDLVVETALRSSKEPPQGSSQEGMQDEHLGSPVEIRVPTFQSSILVGASPPNQKRG